MDIFHLITYASLVWCVVFLIDHYVWKDPIRPKIHRFFKRKPSPPVEEPPIIVKKIVKGMVKVGVIKRPTPQELEDKKNPKLKDEEEAWDDGFRTDKKG